MSSDAQDTPHLNNLGPDPAAPSYAPTQGPTHSSSSNTSKRIFAPGAAPSSSQATQYTKGTLTLSSLSPSPLSQFHTWFTHAQSSSVHQPETVCLSTSHLPTGRVSSRYVYLKELDSTGFVIYSNWGTSNKARDVESNKYASMAFWWHELERQVRVEGRVERLTGAESQVYFDTRIRGSRVGAWASQQSEVLKPKKGGTGGVGGPDKGKTSGGQDQGEGNDGKEEDDGRAELEDRVKQIEKKFEGQDHIPVPEFWGGLRLVPDMVEFWQGRESRLHDRFRYTRIEEGRDEWKLERLSP